MMNLTLLPRTTLPTITPAPAWNRLERSASGIGGHMVGGDGRISLWNFDCLLVAQRMATPMFLATIRSNTVIVWGLGTEGGHVFRIECTTLVRCLVTPLQPQLIGGPWFVIGFHVVA
jgi:hypothetical protein